MNFNAEQIEAINNSGGNILVSAAAGSGKTAVLVERIINRIIADRQDITKFLIVTFTEAAANDMKGKIIRAILKKLSENPEDHHLKRQISLIKLANISTIDAFYLKLIREKINDLGLSPRFKIAVSNECYRIRQIALKNTLEELYRLGDEDFLHLTRTMFDGKSDKMLEDSIITIYEGIQSIKDPLRFLEYCEQNYSNDNYFDICRGIIFERALTRLKNATSILNLALNKLKLYDDLYEKFSPILKGDIESIGSIIHSIDENNWDLCHAAIHSIKFAQFRKAGEEHQEFLEEIVSYRDRAKKIVRVLKDSYFIFNRASAVDDIESMLPVVSCICNVVRKFTENYDAEKYKRNIITFSDLSHLVVRLLFDEDGVKTNFATEVSGRYLEIMIDEYQDINGIQDEIFKCISNGNNLFMVGDLKQSIYRFRHSDPKIFLEKYNEYISCKFAQGNDSRSIILNKNYRSRRDILGSVNFIFSQLMTKEFGKIDYELTDRLNYGADIYDDYSESDYKTEFVFIETNMSEEDMKDDDNQKNSIAIEAVYVADRIKKMIGDGFKVLDRDNKYRPARSGDFAILLRSCKGKIKYYKDALSSVGISSKSEMADGILNCVEIRTLISLLKVIDNNRRDIYVTAVLNSPLFNFKLEDIIQIRLLNKRDTLYNSILEMSCLGDDLGIKCREFLEFIDDMSILSTELPLDIFLNIVYEKTMITSIFGAMYDGVERQINLKSFLKFAESFDAILSKGLFGFIRHIDRLSENNESIDRISPFSGDDSVKIMSIHKSKGLEFPIVFLVDCSRGFNREDTKKNIVINKDLGISSVVIDRLKGIRFRPIVKMAMDTLEDMESMEEQARLLYVAMTRAREKLILISSVSSMADEFKDSEPFLYSKEYYSNKTSYAKWFTLPLLKHKATLDFRTESGIYNKTEYEDDFIKFILLHQRDIFIDDVCSDDYEEGQHALEYKMNIDFNYKYEKIANIPSKLTASMLKSNEQSADITVRKPKFNYNTALSPTEIGIAHHLFMQFIDFNTIFTEQDIKDGIENLVKIKNLTDLQATSLNIDNLYRFFSSDIFKRLRASQMVRKEFEFSILVKADEFYEPASGYDDEVLLQGVIDCLFEEDGHIVIIDFKTDKVSESNIEAKKCAYRQQLDIYERAVEEIFNCKVLQKVLYFFEIGKFITL